MRSFHSERDLQILNGSAIASQAVYALSAVEYGVLNDRRREKLRDAVRLCRWLRDCAHNTEKVRAETRPRIRWAVHACEVAVSQAPIAALLDQSESSAVIDQLETVIGGGSIPPDDVTQLQSFFRHLAFQLGNELEGKQAQ